MFSHEATLIIDPEFQSLLPALTKEERQQLEHNLIATGRATDPIYVWKGHNIVIDGHNRYELCIRHNLPFEITLIELENTEAVKLWMFKHQQGRRNITPEFASYIRGYIYNQEKNTKGGYRNTQKSKAQSEPLISTAEKLADQYKVGKETIKRDAAFANAVDAIANELGPQVRQEILNRKTPISRKNVLELKKRLLDSGREAASQLLDEYKVSPHRRTKPSVNNQLKSQAQSLGLPTSPNQVLPDIQQGEDPATCGDVKIIRPYKIGDTVQICLLGSEYPKSEREHLRGQRAIVKEIEHFWVTLEVHGKIRTLPPKCVYPLDCSLPEDNQDIKSEIAIGLRNLSKDDLYWVIEQIPALKERLNSGIRAA
ncbi:hypothetical protein Cri9333_0364 [Crinalium epipsammum PCC 9333]|uniref:ParB/Sulfiredoxin domain-containing protein n=1 Tax=Crinalium epipsammum PCC 9333 TaxID=1173022 RepID=K9VUV7_9CYAN|nr:hypothetical protein [Crinalium epipsammum]AFZ11344.1 hypothetical protein Cri9333_0364 [Crinalium epipsammum PCC 9333]